MTTSVWEEALVEELVYLLAHLAHTEQHLVEADSAQEEPIAITVADKIRRVRKMVGEVLYDVIGLKESETSGGEFRGRGESLWCTLKHLSMALVHCEESAEKIAKRMVEALEKGDTESAEKYREELKKLYKARREVLEAIKKVLYELPETMKAIEAIRCREDLCLEEEAKAVAKSS